MNFWIISLYEKGKLDKHNFNQDSGYAVFVAL